MSLTKNILANVLGTYSSKDLYEKLEGLYQEKCISNRFLLNEQFHRLHLDQHNKVYNHLSIHNGIIYELETIEVKIDDKYKALRLIQFLPSSYEHIKPVLIYGKETLSFEEVASKIIYEERRLKSEDNTSSNSVLVSIGRPYVKKNNETCVRCLKCGNIWHVKCRVSSQILAMSTSLWEMIIFSQNCEVCPHDTFTVMEKGRAIASELDIGIDAKCVERLY